MRIKLIPLFIAFSLSLLQGQYIKYHNLVNEANEQRYKKNYEASLQLFQAGFELVDYVHAMNYVKAATTAAQLKQYNLVAEYLSNAMLAGYPRSVADGKVFNGFRKSDHYDLLQAKLIDLDSKTEQTFDQTYRRKIDSLHFIDQNILRQNTRVTGFEPATEKAYSDSMNFVCLLKLIKEFGFPSEQKIGYQGYRKAWVIIHHSARLAKNHWYHPQLFEFVKSGAYQPENYCWVIDQGQEVLGQSLVYYHWDVAQNIDELTDAQMDEIDARRKAVGLASVRRIEVVDKSGKRRNKLRW